MIRKFINHTVELSLLSPAVDATYVDEVSPATAPVQVSCKCRDATAFQSFSFAVLMVSLANQAYTTAKLSRTRGVGAQFGLHKAPPVQQSMRAGMKNNQFLPRLESQIHFLLLSAQCYWLFALPKLSQPAPEQLLSGQNCQ